MPLIDERKDKKMFLKKHPFKWALFMFFAIECTNWVFFYATYSAYLRGDPVKYLLTCVAKLAIFLALACFYKPILRYVSSRQSDRAS